MRTSALERKATSSSYKLYVAIVVMINIIPHCFYLPVWVIIIAAIFIIWSILNIYRNVKLPSVMFRNVLVAISSGLIFLNYKTIFGAEPAAAIFVVISAVKLVDFTKYRDGMTEIILCYLLLLTHLLSSQSLGSTLFFTVDVFIITTLMHQLHKNDRRHSARTFLPSLKMLFLAIPIWIFLFLVFPRFSATLLRVRAPQASTGFSPKLVPGSVSELMQSDETAFRVKFDRAPAQDQLYFRGAILSKSDGLSWSKAKIDDEPAQQTFSRSDKTIGQEIVIEPSFQRYLFALDYPIGLQLIENEILQKSGGVYQLRYPLQNRVLYHVESVNNHTESMSEDARKAYLQTPQVSKQVSDLAQRLSKGAHNSRDKISNIMSYFATQKFLYSLQPGEMKGDALNQFLFEKKVGFCEHYAAALSTLARLMNVPSRVVVGFQGGKLNELTDYYVIKTLDAHAWSEIWSEEDHRWMRMDPTVVVAPIRVTYGADAYRQGVTKADIFDDQNSVTTKLGSQLFFAFDAITTKWNNFLLKYDFDYQNKLLEELGFSHSSRLTLIVLLFLGLAALMIAVKIYFSSQRAKVDPVLSLYHQFCKKLEDVGLVRARTEGPEEFLRRVRSARPANAELIEQALAAFIRIRYAEVRGPADVKTFRNMVRKF